MDKAAEPGPPVRHAEIIFALIAALFAIGVVNIFSASFVVASQMLGDSRYFLHRHLIYSLIGLIGMIGAIRADYRRLRPLAPLFAGLAIVLLAAVHFAGVDANGARRWLQLPGLKFQPSELAKLAVVWFTAVHLGRKLDYRGRADLFSLPVYAAAVMAGLTLIQPDMGTAIIIFGLCLAMYILTGIPRPQMLGLSIFGAAGLIYLVFAASYRSERILAWLNPWDYAQTSGYQAVQALLAIGSGGLTGVGFGMGASKFHYLPEAYTDFSFAVLCQEMGFIGAAVVLVLLGLLVWYGAKVAAGAPDGFGTMLAAGVTVMIVGQAVGNIAMVCGLLPVTGIPLPFISFGGTSLVVNMVAAGLLISVARRCRFAPPAAGTASAGSQDMPDGGRPDKGRLRVIRSRFDDRAPDGKNDKRTH